MAKLQKKNVYFARHGERLDWIDRTWIETAECTIDPPLSLYGLEQAHELGTYIATLQPQITHIYSSPYLRTIQTALQVAIQLNENVSSSDQMTKIRLEPGYGEYFLSEEQRDDTNIYRPLQRLPEISQHLQYFDQAYDSVFKAEYYLQTGVETRQHLRERLKRTLQLTLKSHEKDCNILIVTHAAPLIEAVRALLTITQERNQQIIKKEEINIGTDAAKNRSTSIELVGVRTGVCSLTHLEWIDEEWSLSKNGLTSYLSKGEQNPWTFPDDLSS